MFRRAVAIASVSAVALAFSRVSAQPGPDDVSGGARVDTLVGPFESDLRIAGFVIPGSERLQINGMPVDSGAYAIDYRYGGISLPDGALAPNDTLIVHYRTFPFAFKDVYRRHAPVGVASAAGAHPTTDPPERRRDPPQDLFGNVELQRSGSITRGIIAGNNRDVSVESGLRMQLSGEVAEGVRVQAVLTDENTPIQPEGVTRRLSEFDRVAIRVESGPGAAQLGDFDLSFGGTRLAAFDRKLQGISVVTTLPESETGTLSAGSLTVAGATSRGVYHAHEIQPIDGVQGPYRLLGKEGEQFIIVIAGSEAVYMDGRRLTRGETHDYVIDYQTGEITFTATRLITDARRIQVEFQYTTFEFTRTILAGRADVELWRSAHGRPRMRLGTTFLREADSREFNAELGLTPLDSLALVQAGDGLAWRSGAEPVAFDPEAPFVQYRLEVQPLPDGSLDTVYSAVASAPGPDETVYRVRFSRVGPGLGSYARVGRTVNGIQYEYRGQGLGDYEPIRILPKPRQQRLVAFHGETRLLAGINVFGEWAHSLNDENRLSSLDADDNIGGAFLVGLRVDSLAVAPGEADLGHLSALASRQFTGGNFRSFGRTRPIEFIRRWNLGSRPSNPIGGVLNGGDERVDEVALAYQPTEMTRFGVEGGELDLGGTFVGSRRALVFHSRERRLPNVEYAVEYVSSADSATAESGEWLRQLGSISEPFMGGRLVPFLEVEHERRQQRLTGSDSLILGSLAFTQFKPSVSWNAERITIAGEVEYRLESDGHAGNLRDAARAWTWLTRFSLKPSRQLSTQADLGYRVRRFNDLFRIEHARQNTESVVLRWNGGFHPLRRAIETDWLYEGLTERTPTMQEIYIQTRPGHPDALYVWEDANGDGIIQLDEFVPALTPNEGTYVRTFVPSDSLMSVVSVQSRLRVHLDPARVWTEPGAAWKRALAHVSSRSTIDIQEKSREPRIERIYLMRPGSLLQPGFTLNGRVRLQQELFFFRRNKDYGFDLSYSQLRGMNELASGRERRFLNNWQFEGRSHVSGIISARLRLASEQSRLESDAFASRRYDIRSVAAEPEVILAPSTSVQVRLGTVLSRKNDPFNDRRARLLRFPVEARLMRANRVQVTGRFELADVVVRGEAVGLARYELTDGRGPGTSYLWHLNAQYRVSEYLRASFAYDGRAPAEAPMVHTMRIQMSAVF